MSSTDLADHSAVDLASDPARASADESRHTSDSRKTTGTRRENAVLSTDTTPVPDVLADADTLADARRIYVGRRETAEAEFTNTLHKTARANYRTVLEADRALRRRYADPSIALLTLCASPVDGGEWIAPLGHTEAVGEALSNVLARLHQLLAGHAWEYAAVRGASKQGVAHWHLVIWVDGTPAPETFHPAIQSFINNCQLATATQNPLGEAVKVNPEPSRDLTPMKRLDRERGAVSPIARYVATQIPHISPVGQLAEAEACQGALEWAARTRGFRCSTGVRDAAEAAPVARESGAVSLAPTTPCPSSRPTSPNSTPALARVGRGWPEPASREAEKHRLGPPPRGSGRANASADAVLLAYILNILCM